MYKTKSKNKLLKIMGVFLLVTLLFSCKQKEETNHSFLIGPYVQNVTTEGITISWEDTEQGKGVVYYGKTPELKNKIESSKTGNLHEVSLSGLDIETKYYYQVESNGKKSEVFHFNTAKKHDSPFTFVAYGDNKNGPFNHQKIADLVSKADPDFVLHNGDLVDRGGVHKQWVKLFFTPAKNMINHIPLFTVIGNHEDNNANYYNYFSPPTSDKNAWYSFNYGNAHFVMLHVDGSGALLEDPDSTQLKWFVQDLKDNQDAKWKFVLMHKPVFSSGGQHYVKYRLKINKLLVPIFDKYNVDMTLSGDDHHYERTYPIGNIETEIPATYVVCGNGGTPMRYVIPSKWTKKAGRIYGFNKISIDGSQMHFQHITINGDVLDEFKLDKDNPESVAEYKKDMLDYSKLVDIDPEVATAYRAGRKLLKKKKYSEAIADLDKALTLDSTCYIAMALKSEALMRLGDLDNGFKLAMHAHSKIPQFDNVYEALIRYYVEKENYPEALAWCDSMEIISSYSPDVYEERADIYEKMGDTNNMIKSLESAIKILPNGSDLYFKLGELHAKLGDTAKMLMNYKKGVEWYMEEPEAEAEDENYHEILKIISETEKK